MAQKANIAIVLDDLSDGNIIRLLRAHRNDMLKHSPPESVHALDETQLRLPELTFWSARVVYDKHYDFAGCGAVKNLGEGHGELKSMKTERAHLRKGVAQTLLDHIIEWAKTNGFNRISLETGTQDVFRPARTLYYQNGFRECNPFSDYKVDPLSVCMTRSLHKT